MVMTHNMSSVDDAYLIADKTGLVHLVRFPNPIFPLFFKLIGLTRAHLALYIV